MVSRPTVTRRPVLAVGAIAAAALCAVLVVAAGATSATSTRAVVVTGAVALDGALESSTGADGWLVGRSSTGRYVVARAPAGSSPAPPVSVELVAWDAPARATVTPSAGGGAQIAFDLAGVPVDTRFTFTISRAGSGPGS